VLLAEGAERPLEPRAVFEVIEDRKERLGEHGFLVLAGVTPE
jgi:hypothetical protein